MAIPFQTTPTGRGADLRREVVRELTHFDWRQSNGRAGLRGLPALAIVLAAGVLAGDPAAATAAAVGAMPVGFGSFQRIGRSRVAPMLLASLGMGLAAFCGSLASPSGAGVVLVTAGWAFAYGLLTALEPGLAWVGLQCVIVVAVCGGYPVSPQAALTRGVLTLGGGLLQTLVISSIWRVRGQASTGGGPVEAARTDPPTIPAWKVLRGNLSPGSRVGRYAWQLCLALALAVVAYHWLGLVNGYWVPMTVAIVLKPGFQQTFARSLARMAGTLLGAGVATLLAATLRPGPGTLAVLVVAFAWFCYALLNVNYGLYAVGITSYVVFLLAMVGLPETDVVIHRAVNTALGGALALVAYGHRLPVHVVRTRRMRRRAGPTESPAGLTPKQGVQEGPRANLEKVSGE